ncbi:Zinc metalloproteinase nas-14 [Trichinella zimbabwensis]|uniref:Metalloendopeptidase n=1 Tax=Trichinella zimbabwensis TaxID=268475 RepID=A0A0V1HBG4_9BILA|nr:Zinc metalloproteinase nas-14 [Trichinella zimbabwensis]
MPVFNKHFPIELNTTSTRTVRLDRLLDRRPLRSVKANALIPLNGAEHFATLSMARHMLFHLFGWTNALLLLFTFSNHSHPAKAVSSNYMYLNQAFRPVRLNTNTKHNTSVSKTDNTFLTPADFEKAQHTPSKPPTKDGLLAMQMPTLFEGDIAGFRAEEFSSKRLKDSSSDPFSFPHNTAVNLDTFPEKLWENARVPYVLDDKLTSAERMAIAQAFLEYNQKTCIRFVPKLKNDQDYVLIKKNKRLGCSSFVGRAGGNQTLSLEVEKCFSKGIIAHELMHVLGFFHEHSRTDRDNFVRIIENNVLPGMLKNFEKYSNSILDTLKMPYDYGSVMHYHKLAFSKNGRATIVPYRRKTNIGQRFQLSEIDAAKINKLYNCHNRFKGKISKIDTASQTNKQLCSDSHDHCKLWTDLGHCKWSKKYMKDHCKLSCGLCKSGNEMLLQNVKNSRCRDRNLFCPYWARIGECKNEKKFMNAYCQKSCNFCKL